MEPNEPVGSGIPGNGGNGNGRERPIRTPDMNGSSMELIGAHIERHIGPIDVVYHEIVSELVHIDVHVVLPDEGRKHITMITTGMSDKPMAVAEGAEEYRHAELLIHLPPDWPLTDEAFEDENNYWPIRWLKFLARFPHEYDTWLGYGHTVPNGDPPESLASETPFSGFLLELPMTEEEDFFRLYVSKDKTIHFYTLIPLFKEEMDVKLRKGVEHLEQLFDRYGIGDIVDLNRPNVGKSRFFGLFRG